MILLDSRTGSGDLAHFFKSWGVPYDLTTLEYGDAAMAGQSPYDTIGVEIKKVRDALQCMCDGRFAGHQLPGLIKTYEAVWLVIEGHFNVSFDTRQMTVSGKHGLQHPLKLGKTRTFQYRSFDHWLMTLEIKGGVRVKRTASRCETAQFLTDLQTWFDKPLDRHRSHLAFHEVRPDAALLVPMSPVIKVAKELPGIGWQRAQVVGKHFDNVRQMMGAPVDEWEQIDGIGPTMARTIYNFIRGQ
jgi:ERCC4-type nuclease